MGKQFGKEIMPQVMELRAKGYTLTMIGTELGYTKKGTVKNYAQKGTRP
jgi:DNA-binding NarL/FixJ family response regulator